MDMLNWINDSYILQDPATGRREPFMSMAVAYLRQLISAIKAYKDEAEKNSIWGSDTAVSCSREKLAEQLDMAMEVFPEVVKKRHPSVSNRRPISLAWKGVLYEVLCDGKPLHKSKG
jgi:hypothetical protein